MKDRTTAPRGRAPAWLATLALVACILAGCRAGLPQETAGDATVAADGRSADGFADDPALRFQRISRSEPRPLSINILTVDLQDPRYELVVAVADDPDGDGPAQAALVPPTELAAAHHMVVAMNANAFAALPDADGNKHHNWHDGMHVTIGGLANENAVPRSEHVRNYPAFWQSADMKLHAGQPSPAQGEGSRQGVAGFHDLIDGGKILPKDREGAALHPRSAIGFDETGRYLHFVVVDGRQSGFSEGMSVFELATFMKDELNCHEAINLDGGGSSILLMTNEDGKLVARNRPSTRVMGISMHRPVPVMIGLRRK